MSISDERLADIAAEYGSMADGLPPQLEDGPGAASAFYMSCALGEIAAMATELQSLRAAAAQLAAVTAENARLREAIADLNVTDQELVRIHNMCTGFDGDVKIWAKMLHKLAVFALAARAALSQEAPK